MEEENSSNNTRLLLALLGGAAIGFGIGYLLYSEKKETILDTLKEKTSKLKDDVDGEMDKGKSIIEDIEDIKNIIEGYFKKS